MKPLAECRLYTFVDAAYLNGHDPIRVTEELCLGGSDIIQLRAKDWRIEKVAETAINLLPITRQFGVHLVINDHLSIAHETGAEFCHLGQEDFFDSGHNNASELLGGGVHPQIGLSTHAPEQAARALAANPAYIAIGPVYPTGTKPTARPVTLSYVRWAAENVPIPWFAIGGINLSNLHEVLAAGAKRICVVSAISGEANIAAACREFRFRLEQHP